MLQPSTDRGEPEPSELEDEEVCAHCGRGGALADSMELADLEESEDEPEPDKEKDKAAFIEALKRKGGKHGA